ncbi:cold shock domain-containing protein [Nocardioides dongxiaopingii]|uniref:cold shock domain-containing protein n=1 Tax=Nocardioides dongxiaopingii TaxID=2576036 RepID=UPI0010C76A78|nr:cold shock domain-containing protein [Nocardioides dongxiaopingii]
MSASGVVRVWDDEEGWGVIDSALTPGGCWTHFSSVLVGGFASLTAGQDVAFEFEAAEQDGFRYAAVAAWPADQDPVPRTEIEGSTALRSTLTLTFDEPGTSDPG